MKPTEMRFFPVTVPRLSYDVTVGVLSFPSLTFGVGFSTSPPPVRHSCFSHRWPLAQRPPLSKRHFQVPKYWREMTGHKPDQFFAGTKCWPFSPHHPVGAQSSKTEDGRQPKWYWSDVKCLSGEAESHSSLALAPPNRTEIDALHRRRRRAKKCHVNSGANVAQRWNRAAFGRGEEKPTKRLLEYLGGAPGIPLQGIK